MKCVTIIVEKKGNNAHGVKESNSQGKVELNAGETKINENKHYTLERKEKKKESENQWSKRRIECGKKADPATDFYDPPVQASFISV